MKKILLITLFLLYSKYNFACNSITSKDYKFIYSYNEITTEFKYQIIRKDNNEFTYFNFTNYGTPKELGFIIVDMPSNKYIYKYNLENYLYENNDYFSSHMIYHNEDISEPLNKNKFITVKSVNNNYQMNYLIQSLQPKIPYLYSYGVHPIIIKLKFILDPQINQCLIFETKPINYNFGSKAIIDLKNRLDDIDRKKYINNLKKNHPDFTEENVREYLNIEYHSAYY